MVKGDRALLAQFERTEYTGPIPDPHTFEHYERVLPGSGKTIFAMAEREQAHRHLIESGCLTIDTANARSENNFRQCGQIFGFVLGIIGIGGGLTLLALGRSIAGSGVAITAMGTLIGLFVYKERKAAAQDNSASPDKK